MKKETLIKVIDEEFGDDKELSWIIDVFHKAIVKNDSRITECTKEYETRINYVVDCLSQMRDVVKDIEKQELKNGVRITHKRNRKETKDNE